MFFRNVLTIKVNISFLCLASKEKYHKSQEFARENPKIGEEKILFRPSLLHFLILW